MIRSRTSYVQSALLFFILFIFTPLLFIHSQEGTDVSAAVVHIGLESSDTELENILNRSVLLELRIKGISGTSLRAEVPIPSEVQKSELENIIREYLSRSFPAEHDLLIAGFYSLFDDSLLINYFLFSVQNRKRLSSLEISDSIDLFIDRDIAEVVNSLIDSSRNSISSIAENKKRATSEPQETVVAVQQDEMISTTASEAADSEPEEPDEKSLPEDQYELFVSSAIPLFLNPAAEQFPFALQIKIGFLYSIAALNSIRMRIGLSAGFLRLIPRDAYKGTYIRGLIPLESEFLFSFQESRIFPWSLSLGLGAALRLPAESEASQLLSPALPYAHIGIAFDLFRFGKKSSIAARIDSLALLNLYQENSSDSVKADTLLSISPGIYARWRF